MPRLCEVMVASKCRGGSAWAAGQRVSVQSPWKVSLLLTLLCLGSDASEPRVNQRRRSSDSSNTKIVPDYLGAANSEISTPTTKYFQERKENIRNEREEKAQENIFNMNITSIDTSNLKSYDFARTVENNNLKIPNKSLDTYTSVYMDNASSSVMLNDASVKDVKNYVINVLDEKNIEHSKVEKSSPVKESSHYRDTFIDSIIDDIRRRENMYYNNEEIENMVQNTEQMIVIIGSRDIQYVPEEPDPSDPAASENRGPTTERYTLRTTESNFNLNENVHLNIRTKESKPFARKTGQDLKVDKEVDMDYQGDMPFERLPRLEIIKDEVLSELNVTQILECNIPKNTTMTEWYKDGTRVRINSMGTPWYGRAQIVHGGNIIISKISRIDDGAWTCQGIDSTGRIINAKRINLIVLGIPHSPSLHFVGGNLSADGSVLTCQEKSTVLATCRVQGGRPKPTLTWSLRPPLSDITLIPEEKKLESGAESTLKLRIHRDHHNLSLICITSHPALALSYYSPVKIIVEYPPRFAITRNPVFGIPLEEGIPASLLCEVDSFPPAKPRWHKGLEGKSMAEPEGGFLNFTALEPSHGGWYHCSANHTTGVFSSIAYLLIVRQPTLEDKKTGDTSGTIEIELGGAIQLVCPKGSVGCWSKLVNGNWTGAGSGAAHGALSIPELLYQQAGKYRCEGMSAGTLGRLQVLKEATIIVTGGPTVFPMNSTVMATEGTRAELTAEVCANPGLNKVMWIAGDKVVRMGNNVDHMMSHHLMNITGEDCGILTLTIDPVDMHHDGEYSLLVRNSKSSTEAVFILAVTASGIIKKNFDIFEWLGISRNGCDQAYMSIWILCCSLALLMKVLW